MKSDILPVPIPAPKCVEYIVSFAFLIVISPQSASPEPIAAASLEPLVAVAFALAVMFREYPPLLPEIIMMPPFSHSPAPIPALCLYPVALIVPAP